MTGTGITRYEDLPGATASAKLRAARTPQVSLPPGVVFLTDFTDNNCQYGLLVPQPVTSLVGSGSRQTVLEFVRDSSTRPSPATGLTQIRVLRIGFGDKPNLLAGLTVHCTPQAKTPYYHAVQLYRSLVGTVVRDVVVKGTPGTGGLPPTESFSIEIFRGQAELTDVELDGTDDTGAKVASSLLAGSYATGLTVTRGHFHDCNQAALTNYLCSGSYLLTDTVFSGSKVGANFEQFSDGSITLVRPTFRGNVKDIVLDSTLASTKVLIQDPVLAPGQQITVLIHPVYSFGLPKPAPVLQKKSDVVVTVGGVARPDLLRFL